MWDAVLNGPQFVCHQLSNAGVGCRTVLFQINLWQLFVVIIITLITTWIARYILAYRNIDEHGKAFNIEAPFGAISDKKTIKLNPYTMADLLGENGYQQLGYRASSAKLNAKYSEQFFVVQFMEAGRKIVRTETRLVASWFTLERNQIRMDPVTLSLLKGGSENKIDDETGDSVGADGVFDMFVRPVRWWDVRHWLFHPSREIRFALYVAIFAAVLEYSSTLIDLLKAILKTPA